jgi:signal transduction histidine kinase
MTSEPIDWTNWLNHELKTPLNRMESLILSLEKRPSMGFEEKKLMLSLKTSLDECRSTIDSLYLYNKIQIEKIHPKLDHHDINALVSQVCQDLDSQAERKAVKFVIESEPLFPLPLDEQLFKRALSNIISNAIKFSPEDSRVLISTESIKDKVYVQVADQGVGVEESQQNKIFEPYYRIEDTAHLPGTGLGLYIAKKFMKYMDGDIFVDSEKGAGTTFTIELPSSQGAS